MSTDRDLLPPLPPHVASEFLLWLAFRETQGNEDYTLSNGSTVTIGVCEDVELKRPEEDKPSVVLRGLDSSAHPELLASLRAGRMLHRAKLSITSGERTYRLTLTGPTLAWSGIKLPRLLKSDEIGKTLHEELFLYEELDQIMRQVFGQYARRRVDAERWTQESG